MLPKFGKTDSPLCSLCKTVDEIPLHISYNCTRTKSLSDQLKEFNSYTTLSIPSPMSQNDTLGHIDFSND